MKRFIKIIIRFLVVLLMLSVSILGGVMHYMSPVTSVVAWIGFAIMIFGAGGALHHILK